MTGSKSDRVRVYRIERDHLDEVVGILQRRHNQRQAGSNPIPVENIPETALTRLLTAEDPQSSALKTEDRPSVTEVQAGLFDSV